MSIAASQDATMHLSATRARDRALPREKSPNLLLMSTDYTRSLYEWGSLSYTWPLLACAPRGDGHPVLVLPGLGTGDGTTVLLRNYLRWLGYRSYSWGLGRNLGPTAKVVEGMPARLADIARRNSRPVTIIGWSLGGIFARRLAREYPESVRQVITLGSPFRLQGHANSNARWLYDRVSADHVLPLQTPIEQGLGPLPVPATSIYSRLDGIVPWTSCIDDVTPMSENIEIYGSHLGFGQHPAALLAVADRLAQPEGAWRPFRPHANLRWAYPTPEPR